MKKELIDVSRLSKGIYKYLSKSGHNTLKLSEIQEAVSRSLGFNNYHATKTTTISTDFQNKSEFDFEKLINKISDSLNKTILFVLNIATKESGIDIFNDSINQQGRNEFLRYIQSLISLNRDPDTRKIDLFSKKIQRFYFNNENTCFLFNNTLFYIDFYNIYFVLNHIYYTLNERCFENTPINESCFLSFNSILKSITSIEESNNNEKKYLNYASFRNKRDNCYLLHVVKTLMYIEGIKTTLTHKDYSLLFNKLESLDKKQFELLKQLPDASFDMKLAPNGEFFLYENKEAGNLYFSFFFIDLLLQNNGSKITHFSSLLFAILENSDFQNNQKLSDILFQIKETQLKEIVSSMLNISDHQELIREVSILDRIFNITKPICNS